MRKEDLKDTFIYQVKTGCEISKIEHNGDRLSGPVAANNSDNSLRVEGGKLFSLFTEMDVRQMKKTYDEIHDYSAISDIDLRATACRFD